MTTDPEDDIDDLWQDEIAGMDDLEMEIITETYDEYRSRVRTPGGFTTTYDYDSQVEAFKEDVNDFIDNHTVVDVNTQATADEHGYVRHEACILYRED